MSDTETEEHLVALGVPRHVATYVAEHRAPRVPNLSALGSFALLVGGFAVGAAWLWPTLEARLDHNARVAAEAAGALLYYHNFGVGLLIGVFAWIFTSGLIVGAIPMLSRRLSAGAFYDSIVVAANSGDGLGARAARWGVEKMMRELKDEQDPRRYIERASFAWVRPMALIALASLALTGVVTFRELNAYTLYSVQGYEARHIFPVSPTVRLWSAATFVEVGCNHVTGKNASNDPIYNVHFRDGGSTRIDGAFPVTGSWLDGVERIDAALVRSGATFQPWTWMNRDPYHPQCLLAYAGELNQADYARLRRLIRAP